MVQRQRRAKGHKRQCSAAIRAGVEKRAESPREEECPGLEERQEQCHHERKPPKCRRGLNAIRHVRNRANDKAKMPGADKFAQELRRSGVVLLVRKNLLSS